MFMLEAVYHRAGENWSYAYNDSTIHIRLRTKKNNVSSVMLCCGDKYSWELYNEELRMEKRFSDDLFDYWHAEATPKFRRAVYYFELSNENEKLYYLEKGFFPSAPEIKYEGLFDFPYINKEDVHSPPEWVKDAVFYQIFPERFANGDPSNDPDNVQAWGGTPTWNNFFGGDIQGIIDHLDHLTELGINAVYFNPLFEATTNHKYDTADYMKVDPHFGTLEKLKELVELCHARGIKVMLDCVFNHCGKTFPPFVDAVEKGEASQYKDWFHVREWPLTVIDRMPTYETFAFEPIMPKLNTGNPEVKNYLIEVGKYWIKELAIDGWRLDVANEVDHQFWREFRKAIKEVDPEVFILGEIMHDSMPWLKGDQFDAVMNYPFTNSVLNFFTRNIINAEQFTESINYQLARYPQQVTEVSFNLLGSHDTVRLLTHCKGNSQLMQLATLFQLTFQGAPCIYYGDEIGLDGEYDPLNRKCMEWDPAKQNKELFTFFKHMIELRKTYPALRGNGLKFLTNREQPTLLAYERWDQQDHFLIVMNVAATPSSTLLLPSVSAKWKSIYGNASVKVGEKQVQLELTAYGFTILHTALVSNQA